MLPDVAAVDRAFDYEVPPRFDQAVTLGSIVRVDLHGRRVRGWVIAEGAGAPDVTAKPITRVSSVGPTAEILDLAGWASWRWAGPRTAFLGTASPATNVTRIEGGKRSRSERYQPSVAWARAAFAADRAVLRVGPAIDPWPAVLEAARRGSALVLVPSVARAARLAKRLREAGISTALVPDEWAAAAAGDRVVVGARASAWAPCPDLKSVLVIDAHDEVYEEERAPTWSAWRVAAERARRAGVPCVLVTSCPTLEQLAWGELVATGRDEERRGWSKLEVVDRRGEDPRTGLWSERLVAAVRASKRAVCVLNRKGRARRLACASCGEMTSCARCAAAVVQDEPETLRCIRCAETRPVLCALCGSTKLKALRLGTAKATEELAALTGRNVVEVTANSSTVPDAELFVGTEAVLHRVGRADLVAFVDFDAELSAPHYRAGEAALALLARASRMTRGRTESGRVLVQTRQPDHPAVVAGVTADPDRLSAAERATRQLLRFPPYAAMALVSGAAAEPYAVALMSREGLDVVGPDPAGRWLVRANDHTRLCDALAATPRPHGRLRVAVDPMRA
ncbi:MAG TPA: hypothetical protein VNB24_01700 [Acidimicrobiales bacterium]|nr:hypothetical protein [Acidimicrobiales bacterium]